MNIIENDKLSQKVNSTKKDNSNDETSKNEIELSDNESKTGSDGCATFALGNKKIKRINKQKRTSAI